MNGLLYLPLNKTLEMLLKHPKIEVNLQNDYGRTALMFAYADGSSIGCLERLLAHPKIDLNLKDKYGQTALSLAFTVAKEQAGRLLATGKIRMTLEEDIETLMMIPKDRAKEFLALLKKHDIILTS